MQSVKIYYDDAIGLRVLGLHNYPEEEQEKIHKIVANKMRECYPDYQYREGVIAYAHIAHPQLFTHGFDSVTISTKSLD